MKNEIIIREGKCSYVVFDRKKNQYEIVVFSTNNVNHVVVRTVFDSSQAEIIWRRLESYPKYTRKFHELL